MSIYLAHGDDCICPHLAFWTSDGRTDFSQGTRAAISPLTAVSVTEITHMVAAASSVFKHVGLSSTRLTTLLAAATLYVISAAKMQSEV